MTMENWQDILFISIVVKDELPPILTLAYLTSWIVMGNYVLLNLFLAILIDGFLSKPEKDEDDIFFGEEDAECMGKRLKKKRDMELRKKQEEELALLRQATLEDFFTT